MENDEPLQTSMIDGVSEPSQVVQVQTVLPVETSAVPRCLSAGKSTKAWQALKDAYTSRSVGAFRTRPGDSDAVAWAGDRFPGSVDALEIHFVYPFSIGSTSGKRSGDFVLNDVQTEDDGKDRAFLFGDDGHLRFKELLKTIEIKSAVVENLQRSLSVCSEEEGGANGEIPLVDRPFSQLPLTLKDKHDNFYNLNQVFIRLFSFKVGILRFAIMSQGKIDVQAILDVQNSVMRLDDPKQAGRLTVIRNDAEVGSFLPKEFIRGILNKRFQDWKPDEGTDRLFTFTLAGISQLKEEKEVKMAAYNIGQMEWDAAAAVDEAYVDEFRDNNVYTRFASPTGGLWSCFHPDGGCILFFMEKSDKLPIWGYSRLEKKKVNLFGSSRVLVAFSLIETVVFQRMYLRSLDQSLSSIIMSDKHDQRNLAMLKKVHGELLRFRAKFNSTPLSTTTAGKQQFHLWGSVVGLHEMTANLLETVKDLHEYYNDIEEKASQQRLDILAVILGFLGIAQLVSDIFWAYRNEGGVASSDRDSLNVIVPSSVAGVLLVVAVVFIVITRQKH